MSTYNVNENRSIPKEKNAEDSMKFTHTSYNNNDRKFSMRKPQFNVEKKKKKKGKPEHIQYKITYNTSKPASKAKKMPFFLE